MRVSLILGAACVVGACATPQQQAARESNALLCFVQAAGNPTGQRLASAELMNRSATCTPQLVAIGERELAGRKARQQADGDAMANMGAYLLSQQPQVAPPPAPINCYTTYGQYGASTSCR